MTDRLTYLDHAATTPLRPEAREAMLPWLGEWFGNPSGAHPVARRARQVVDEARDAVAEVVGCRPGEVVFTSGGTEADNLAIRGVRAARPGPILCSAIEHEAVLQPVEHVGGATVGVDAGGTIDLDALAVALTPDTALVSVMAANNEVGAVQPVPEVVDAVRRVAPGAVVHTDAVQAVPWLDVASLAAGAGLVSLSAHKFGGPQGVGALVVRRGAPLRAVTLGGGQERELRSGTHNVAGIAGMAAALRAVVATRAETASRVRALRDRLADGLVAAIPGAVETGVPAGVDGAPDRSRRLPGTVHLCLAGVESEALLFLAERAGVCASAASACASGAQQASHVLAAMGVSPALAGGALRLTLGWTSTAEDVDAALEAIPAAAAQLAGRAAVRAAVRAVPAGTGDAR